MRAWPAEGGEERLKAIQGDRASHDRMMQRQVLIHSFAKGSLRMERDEDAHNCARRTELSSMVERQLPVAVRQARMPRLHLQLSHECTVAECAEPEQVHCTP